MAKASGVPLLKYLNKIRMSWSNLRSSLWFIPSLLVAGSAALAVVLIDADPLVAGRWPRLFGAGAEGAREMLSTIAGSMIGVAGVTFSITLVALSLAASQYSSRILRNFMGNRITQVVLGIYAGIFTYCLIVLRTVRSGNGQEFVPNVAVFFAFVLALGGVGVLIFFIHHIAHSIQASNIIATIAGETIEAIDRLFPEKPGERPGESEAEPALPDAMERNWRVIPSAETGYIQSVDDATLLQMAWEMGSVMRLERGVGEFVVQDTALVSLAMEEMPDQKTISAVQATFSISSYRTMEQDVAFGIRQIVDVALKALSPGMNDTTTAVLCVDYLSAILARVIRRRLPESRCLAEGELRLLMICPTFGGLLEESFAQIRGSARANPAVLLRILETLKTLAGLTDSPSRRRALLEHAGRIAEEAGRSLESAQDRSRIDSGLARLREALEAPAPTSPFSGLPP